MSTDSPLQALPQLLQQAKQQADAALEQARMRAQQRGSNPAGDQNLLVHGDNLAMLADHAIAVEADSARGAALIYLDPPYASAADYRSRIQTTLADGSKLALEHLAYSDRWANGIGDYLAMLAPRLMLARMALREDGAICTHVDWHAAHWVRVLLDEIFGTEHFVNNLVWSYRSGGASRTTAVPRKHDDLLVYRRSDRFRIHGQRERQYLEKPFMGSKRDEAGRHYVDTILRDVLEGELGLVNEDGTLSTISVRPVLNISAERTGYATQKPIGLLEVLLRWFTKPEDTVVDPFAGSGTTVIAAARLGRNWASCDASAQAVAVQRHRLDAIGATYRLAATEDASTPAGDPTIQCAVTGRIPPEISLTAAPVPASALGNLRPARGQCVDAIAHIAGDPLAAVAGWVCWVGGEAVASSWRNASGQLQTTLPLPAGADAVTLEVVDLVGASRWRPQVSLAELPSKH